MALRRKTRDERGGAALLLSVMLSFFMLGIGAFAVDFGQVYAKRSALQSNVDLAVLAAAAELDNPGGCNPEVVTTAEEYLLKDGNEVADQIGLDLGGAEGDDDGFIRCNNWRVDLWAPRVRVDFGLAKALSDSNDGVDVPAHAAAQIKAAGKGSSLPMYGVQGCDTGAQTISDPPPGPAVDPVVPDLEPDSATYDTTEFTIQTPNPAEVASGTAPPVPMTLLRKNPSDLTGTTVVGFTNPSASPSHVEVPLAELSVSASTVNLSVPADVLSQDGVWWVRIQKGANWSEEQKAQSFTVGDIMFCDGAISGNFGTLHIARSENNFVLERNIATGIEPELAVYGDLAATSCTEVNSDHAPVDGTNCLRTDPGFANSAATNGLVTGFSTVKGRLDKPTTPGCSRSGGDGQTSPTPTNPHGIALNDDLLTCFFVDDTTTIQDAVDGEENILSADILSSPRFFMIPILPIEAEHGASEHYPIIGFRPGFITDQPLHASQGAPAVSSISEWNGVGFHSNHVDQLDVVLFDERALPESAPAVGGEEDYTGSGTKAIVLVE